MKRYHRYYKQTTSYGFPVQCVKCRFHEERMTQEELLGTLINPWTPGSIHACHRSGKLQHCGLINSENSCSEFVPTFWNKIKSWFINE